MAHVRLIPATPTHLAAYLRDPQELADLLGSPVPDGWPEFPEAVPFTRDVLEQHPEQAAWWMHFFVDDATGRLVGSGGFSGPPQDRTVEIGYEIAPAHRRRGLASAAAEALVEQARRSGEVDVVVAHTLAADERSVGVLRRCGFTESGRLTDPDEGEVVRWARRL